MTFDIIIQVFAYYQMFSTLSNPYLMTQKRHLNDILMTSKQHKSPDFDKRFDVFVRTKCLIGMSLESKYRIAMLLLNGSS